MNNLLVVSPREKVPEGFTVIDTTSKDEGLGKHLSPFFLGPIPLYEDHMAHNMENAWQFSKVYSEFADDENRPLPIYFKWAIRGWRDTYAHRYPNGKGVKPLYSYWKIKTDSGWEEKFWTYIDARKNIYFPLYAKAIVKTTAFEELKKRVMSGEKIALWDYDGYDHAKRFMTYEEVVHSEKYKCGHAFVLYGLLLGYLEVVEEDLRFNF